MWWVYALLSALFASLTAIFAKIGVTHVNSNLATAIRTVIILSLPGVLFFSGENIKQCRTCRNKPVFSDHLRTGHGLVLDILF